MPDILWVPSGNFGYPRGKIERNGQKIEAICDHIIQGSRASYHTVIANPKRNAANYSVHRDGSIEQHVKDWNAAWCNGPMNRPDLRVEWIKRCFEHNINPNLLTISIEHEGFTGEPFTEAQYQATLWLHDHLCTMHSIPRDRNHIVGHFQIDSVNKPFCPGKAFPWARLLADLNPNRAETWEGIGVGIKDYCQKNHLADPDHKLWHGWDPDGDEVVKLKDGKIVYYNKRNGHIEVI